MRRHSPTRQSELSCVIAKNLQDSVGQNVIVENKPGANAAIGIEALLRSDPDGHTLIILSDSPVTLKYGNRAGSNTCTWQSQAPRGTSKLTGVLTVLGWRERFRSVARAVRPPRRWLTAWFGVSAWPISSPQTSSWR